MPNLIANIDVMIDACKAGRLEEVRQLLDANPPLAIASTPTGAQPIHAAHFAGHPDIVALLYERGVNLDAFLAADLGDIEILQSALEDHPPFPKEFGPNGHTALHRACYWGQVEAARFLLDHGADPNAVTEEPYLQIHPLGCAVATADVPNPSDDEAVVLELVKLLVDRGARVNARRKDGLTALHTAAYRGHLNVIQCLLAHGADANIRGVDRTGPHSGKLAVDFASAQGHTAAVELLQARHNPVSKGSTETSESSRRSNN